MKKVLALLLAAAMAFSMVACGGNGGSSAAAGGNGGGKPDFAMAGIKEPSKIDDALNAVPDLVRAALTA